MKNTDNAGDANVAGGKPVAATRIWPQPVEITNYFFLASRSLVSLITSSATFFGHGK